MSIGNRLREERKRLKLTQAEMGGVGGVMEMVQKHYESGDHFPDGQYLCGIAAIGADINYIITGQSAARGLDMHGRLRNAEGESYGKPLFSLQLNGITIIISMPE